MSAPDSFLMMESGRARTYSQRNAPDVKEALNVCPVRCMHKVSYDELVTLEKARDKAGKQNHIPVHVANRESDMNRKGSVYHYLKHKCYSKCSPECVEQCAKLTFVPV